MITNTTGHYLFSPEHDSLREAIRRWTRQRVAPFIEEWERAGEFPRAIFEELGELGYLGAQYPEQYGGQDGDFAANLVLCEELSRAGAESVSTAVAVHTAMASSPILKYGTEAQRLAYLPDLLAGRKVAALGISESGAGSDVASLRTRARRGEDGGWIIDGDKTFITNGIRADVLLLIARTDGDGASPAFSLFLVDTHLPGFSRGRKLEKIGRHASDTAELRFDGLRLPEDALLGEEARGFHQIMWELDAERIVSGATSVALGYHALDVATDYITTRKQFGRPIADFQAVRHNLATLTARLTAARELVHTTARRFQAGEERIAEIPMAKLVAAEALWEVADYALQLHGGYGYMAEYPIGRIWVDARVKRITAGTDEIQRELIARHLLGRPQSP
ncbi:MAG TPA: acyl-CoA dehydrogenase family protein [Solirubrobacteraceae bacterium]|jgi:alkylation response protein AidB-like acyl-CoA dehydrogenase|nr:acyl-CoA dehydrogenase family protein [Solirubrobacteraceae bacterium]